jgi:hypothetical protein
MDETFKIGEIYKLEFKNVVHSFKVINFDNDDIVIMRVDRIIKLHRGTLYIVCKVLYSSIKEYPVNYDFKINIGDRFGNACEKINYEN